ncbi:MAG TPA: hypothetical protein VLD64_00585 [Nitrosarchaeum sp.]|nr:hypothetical protein [Nitrosarchaeum sp.]
MVLGIIIILVGAAIIVGVIIKLIQGSETITNLEKTKQCIACGCKTNSLICKLCKKNSQSLK